MTALLKSVAEWNSVAAGIRREEVVGFVPTMGALHKGHGALLEEARSRCSVVVASIFVNPIQFDQKSDYDLYPRVLENDIAFCAARRVDYIFTPSDNEMYPEPQRTFVDVNEVSEHLCGRNRPGHFRGVATVVLKLFHIVQPHFAFFGEKDYQQLTLVRLRLVSTKPCRARSGRSRMESGTSLRSRNTPNASCIVFRTSRLIISIWSTPKHFDPSMPSRDRCELRWQCGLARPDLSITFFANPRL